MYEKDVGFYGGSVALADYCPYIQEFTWRSNNVVVRGSHCMYEENNPSKYLQKILGLNGFQKPVEIVGPERNFALESYGERSKCFDHTDKMWEEMNCEQVRQWQHWGSGCYRYHCKNGRLHIEVMNQTFTCFYPRQELQVSLLAHSWLHSGSLVCPSCEEICGTEFRRNGEKCRPGMIPTKNHPYYFDSMVCGAPSIHGITTTMLTLSLAIILYQL